MPNKVTMYVLTVTETSSPPSVEVCESFNDCLDSIKYQVKSAATKMQEIEQALRARHVWVDENGIKYSIRKTGGS